MRRPGRGTRYLDTWEGGEKEGVKGGEVGGRIYYGEAASCSILVYREFLKAVSWCLDMTAFRVNGERYVSLSLAPCFSAR